MDFLTLPDGPVTLRDVSVPGCLLGMDAELVRRDISIADGRITETQGTPVDMAGAMALPAFVDMHTHLDKGHIWGRAPNPDGTFMGALTTVGTDRDAHWSAEDVRRRMDFALRSAWAHGTRAIRTHLDSIPPQEEITWGVFDAVRADWAGRIDLQGVNLIGIDRVDDGPWFASMVDLVKRYDGVLGTVAYPIEDLRERLRIFFEAAGAAGLDTDFHVDESSDPSVAALRVIAEVALETGFDRPITVGHCCSLAVQDAAEAGQTLDLVARAGLNVVSLPLCNLYLQAREPGITPRFRGVTLVHEMKARGNRVAFASDNTRDPFYAFGDLDMIEVMREATRIAHLDHTGADWPAAFTTIPAAICGFDAPSLAPGSPADLVLCKARTFNEFFSRPQSDRVVLRSGRQIDRTLPDYAELDDLMERS